jgi:hypothetical protein
MSIGWILYSMKKNSVFMVGHPCTGVCRISRYKTTTQSSHCQQGAFDGGRAVFGHAPVMIYLDLPGFIRIAARQRRTKLARGR